MWTSIRGVMDPEPWFSFDLFSPRAGVHACACMAMLVYRILYLPGLLLALPYYGWRMWRRGGYRKGFGNRFGRMRGVPTKRPGIRRIWIQAVSVGELLAIGPLLRKLDASPDMEVVLTTTTSTGYRLLRDKFAGRTCWHGIFPMDFWLFSRLAWRALKPDLVLLMEGELWPEHIHQARRRGVPVALINARLSDRSFQRHYKTRRWGRVFMGKLDAILAGSETDRDRFIRLGWLPESRIHVTGNLKLDVEEAAPVTAAERNERLKELGFTGKAVPEGEVTVLLGSSTWPGEEAALLEGYVGLRETFPGLRLLLVPRHAERRREIESLLENRPVRWHFRTDNRNAPEGTEVYVADTTGELKDLTRCADLVFIGKSLPPNSGGQTPIEAAALGKPILFGPDMSNFRDVTRRLLREGAARKAADAAELKEAIRELLQSPEERERMGKLAGAYIGASRGATERTYDRLRELLNR